MNPTRQVILALFVSGIVFVAAGGQAYTRAGKIGSLLQGNATTTGTGITPPVSVRLVFGWATLALFLIVGSELPGMGDLAAAFGWLIFLGILFAEGPAAFANITSIGNIGQPVPTPPNSHLGGQ